MAGGELTAYIPVGRPSGRRHCVPTLNFVPDKIVELATRVRFLASAAQIKKVPQGHLFYIAMVEAARIELASAGPPPSVLHA